MAVALEDDRDRPGVGMLLERPGVGIPESLGFDILLVTRERIKRRGIDVGWHTPRWQST